MRPLKESEILKKRFDIKITAANSKVVGNFELDKNLKRVKAILMTSSREEILYNRGTQKLLINSEEIFPEEYESKLLMSGINVPPNARYYKTEEIPVGNGKVQIEFQDVDDGRTAFQTYRVSLYLLCETICDHD